jgi:cytochrome d ubiquinol oxidase subunit I
VLTGWSPDRTVRGLDAVALDARPNAAVVHLAFDTMVGLGLAIIAVAAAVVLAAVRRRSRGVRPLLPTGRRWLAAFTVTGPASVLAVLAGWEVTEGGRQPWIVYGRMRVSEAVTATAGIGWAFAGTVAIYLGLATALVLILRRMATGGPPPEPVEAGGLAPPDGPGGTPEGDPGRDGSELVGVGAGADTGSDTGSGGGSGGGTGPVGTPGGGS